PISDYVAVCISCDRTEAEVWTRTGDASSIIQLRRTFVAPAVDEAGLFFLKPADERHVVCLYENVIRIRVCRSSSPVDAAGSAGELNRGLRRGAPFVVEPSRKRARVVKHSTILRK